MFFLKSNIFFFYECLFERFIFYFIGFSSSFEELGRWVEYVGDFSLFVVIFVR